MVKTMSHEQLTPLNAILSISEILMEHTKQELMPDLQDLNQ